MRASASENTARPARCATDARMLNGLLILLCIVIGLFFTATLLHQIRLYV